jgi:hypothetical protein
MPTSSSSPKRRRANTTMRPRAWARCCSSRWNCSRRRAASS